MLLPAHRLPTKEPTNTGRRKPTFLGRPLPFNNIGDRKFADLIAVSGVPQITIHGLRHTCASLLLSAGVPYNVVQKRLGHKDAATTMDVYAHVLPGQQRDAATKLASLLHRKQPT